MTRVRNNAGSRIPSGGPLPPPAPHRPQGRRAIRRALLRGFLRRCPRCGKGSYRVGYLTVRACCRQCGEPLGHIRADDGPAYFTLLIAGHLVVVPALWVEQAWAPPMALLMPAAIAAMLAAIWLLLPSVKGAMVGLMWALGLKGDERQGDL